MDRNTELEQSMVDASRLEDGCDHDAYAKLGDYGTPMAEPYVYDNTKELRAQCVQMAMPFANQDSAKLVPIAKEIWEFVSGETRLGIAENDDAANMRDAMAVFDKTE